MIRGRASRPTGTTSRVRGGTVLFAGALVMHWLCYLPTAGVGGTGSPAGVHRYLVELTPGLIVFAITALAASLLAPFALGRSSSVRAVLLERRAARYAVALLGIFLAQEVAEFIVATNTAGGVDAVVGPAGWLAFPLAFGLGLLAALVAQSLDRVEQRLSTAMSAAMPRQLPVSAAPPFDPGIASLATLSLAFGLARRPPPLARS